MRRSSHSRPHPARGARRAPCTYAPHPHPPAPPPAPERGDDGDRRDGFWAALRQALEGSAGR